MIMKNHSKLFSPGSAAKTSFDQETRKMDATIRAIPAMVTTFNVAPKNTTLKTTGIKNDER